MKWRPDKKQRRWGVTIFLTAAAVLLFYYLLFRGSTITKGIKGLLSSLMPVVYGIIIAYVMSPVLNFFEKRLLIPICKKRGIDVEAPGSEKERDRIRKWSVVLAMLLFLLILFLLLMVIIPQLIKSVQSIMVSFPSYVANVRRMSNTYLQDHQEVADTINYYLGLTSGWITNFTNNTLIPEATRFFRRLSQSMIAFTRGIFNFIIGIIVAIYLLNGKEKYRSGTKKIIYALFKADFANELVAGLRYTHYTFSGFIVGKLIDSVIIGIITYIGALILRTPYPMLMAVIVGVTNIVPFFGPYIGEIVSFILLLMINPVAAVAFSIFVIILQQFDGNILGPRILGQSTGLSSFWVIFSVLFFGSIFGVIGWIIGVPVFAVFYALIVRFIDRNLKQKKLPVEIDAYDEAAYVEKGQIILKKDADLNLYQVRHPSSAWKRIFNIRQQVSEKFSGVVRSEKRTGPRRQDIQDREKELSGSSQTGIHENSTETTENNAETHEERAEREQTV